MTQIYKWVSTYGHLQGTLTIDRHKKRAWLRSQWVKPNIQKHPSVQTITIRQADLLLAEHAWCKLTGAKSRYAVLERIQ